MVFILEMILLLIVLNIIWSRMKKSVEMELKKVSYGGTDPDD
jgi:ABC-type Na+ efflux pump permease subunit